MGADLSDAEFEAIVEDALATLPKRFADMVRNVAIAIEEEPTQEDLELVDEDDDCEDGEGELLGIYRGVPLTERGEAPPLLPDEIAVFRGPIARIARNRADAVREVRETVMHELGHYFGLGDDDMPY
ncbi:MAG TPA: metallopeptidase family protein [Candidatus Acidoferrales bacterium]|nr:metallopeptidase family protein [Candidatus Acidoferrales bacterium]